MLIHQRGYHAGSGVYDLQGALANDRTWIDQAANLLLFGASGLGKSHIAAAVGHALIEQGLRVRYYPASC